MFWHLHVFLFPAPNQIFRKKNPVKQINKKTLNLHCIIIIVCCRLV